MDDLSKSVSGIIDIISNIKNDSVIPFDNKKRSITNYDFDGDGKVSPTEAVIPILERTIKRTQEYSVVTLLIIVGFLLLSAIFNIYGIPLFS